ncbi:DUF2550 domain-containing protein [Sphaerisporangium rhizosphaerae]|uniref:DUF2550 domain-containing protein n=2 Tax=Sphaerisporangium TaxID=321315 RepID=A0ABW2P8K6_9ACTN
MNVGAAMAALDILVSVVVIAALIVLRGVLLARSRGNVVCSLRTKDRAWRSGVARYAGGELHWIPFLGLRLRPRHAIARRGLTVSTRRPLAGDEGPAGYWTVDCAGVSLAMSEDALTGFLAWVESAPPSAHLDAA